MTKRVKATLRNIAYTLACNDPRSTMLCGLCCCAYDVFEQEEMRRKPDSELMISRFNYPGCAPFLIFKDKRDHQICFIPFENRGPLEREEEPEPR